MVFTVATIATSLGRAQRPRCSAERLVMFHRLSVQIPSFVMLATCLTVQIGAAELPLRDQELPTRLEVGYAVRLVDMNDDRRLDIAIVDSKRILWLENPNWREHVMFSDPKAKFDNVCFAPLDID